MRLGRADGCRNWEFATLTFKLDSTFMLDLFDILNGTIYPFQPAGGIAWAIALEPLAGNMLTTAPATNIKDITKGYSEFKLRFSYSFSKHEDSYAGVSLLARQYFQQGS
jgi:hypothetical protein